MVPSFYHLFVSSYVPSGLRYRTRFISDGPNSEGVSHLSFFSISLYNRCLSILFYLYSTKSWASFFNGPRITFPRNFQGNVDSNTYSYLDKSSEIQRNLKPSFSKTVLQKKKNWTLTQYDDIGARHKTRVKFHYKIFLS